MAAAEVERPLPVEEPAPAVPDYLASPNAVFEDKDVQWRYGTPPDYSKTRAVWEKTKTMNHTAGSLPQLVENLVKNWEVEASFKPRLQDWRTIDHENYSFAINGGPPQTAEHMLKVGTYNAIVAPNEYYSPEHTDFAASHKTFKRMMPTFAWEVLEVYSGPPKVAFRWRHWGEMKSDYIAFNNKGEKITAKAHGGKIDIEGVTVAEVDDKVRLRKVETWFDPMEMFRQIAPKGIVNKEIVDEKIGQEEPALTDTQDTLTTGATTGPMQTHISTPKAVSDVQAPADQLVPSSIPPQAVLPKEISPSTGLAADAFVPHQGTADFSIAKAEESTIYTSTIGQQSEPNAHRVPGAFEEASYYDSGAVSDGSDKTWEKVEQPVEANESLRGATVTQPSKKAEGLVEVQPERQIQPLQHGEVEDKVKPTAGEAVAAAPTSHETRMTHEEMSRISATECPFLMNRE